MVHEAWPRCVQVVAGIEFPRADCTQAPDGDILDTPTPGGSTAFTARISLLRCSLIRPPPTPPASEKHCAPRDHCRAPAHFYARLSLFSASGESFLSPRAGRGSSRKFWYRPELWFIWREPSGPSLTKNAYSSATQDRPDARFFISVFFLFSFNRENAYICALLYAIAEIWNRIARSHFLWRHRFSIPVIQHRTTNLFSFFFLTFWFVLCSFDFCSL